MNLGLMWQNILNLGLMWQNILNLGLMWQNILNLLQLWQNILSICILLLRRTYLALSALFNSFTRAQYSLSTGGSIPAGQ